MLLHFHPNLFLGNNNDTHLSLQRRICPQIRKRVRAGSCIELIPTVHQVWFPWISIKEQVIRGICSWNVLINELGEVNLCVNSGSHPTTSHQSQTPIRKITSIHTKGLLSRSTATDLSSDLNKVTSVLLDKQKTRTFRQVIVLFPLCQGHCSCCLKPPVYAHTPQAAWVTDSCLTVVFYKGLWISTGRFPWVCDEHFLTSRLQGADLPTA